MKSLYLLMLILGTSLFADSFDSKQFFYNGSSSQEQVSLSTEVTKTIYENRVVRSTCYRSTSRRVCRRECRNNRCRNVCRNVISRRPYTCYINRTVALEVFDYENISNTTFNFTPTDAQENINETFVISQRGKYQSLKVKGSGNYLVKVKKQFEDVQRDDRARYVTTAYDVSLVDVSLAKKVLGSGINGVSLRSNILKFNLGTGFNFSDFSFNLKLLRNRSLGSDIMLFDRDVRAIAQINDNGFITEVSIDLNKLGVNLPRKKRVIVDLKYNLSGSGYINLDDVKTSAYGNWKFK